MSDNSKIEWTDATWNPVRGCTKVSPGCTHCYAETFAERFRGVPGHPFEFGFDLRLVPEKLGDPIRWSKPKKIFVNSMSDMFHEGVADEYIEKVCRVMLAADWHTYQVLTKRADRMAAMLQGKQYKCAKVFPPRETVKTVETSWGQRYTQLKLGVNEKGFVERPLRGYIARAAEAAHIWWGVSVENRKHGLPRIAKLRSAKPRVAFL